ncbi:hypothetical protein F4778DRAFT_600300 [Xylariomycetidae sp. FL2044]|nr:hypothetical protein F4778DRAFT_600300 [Xylariomycetidae sp. FL2044]
MSTHPTVKERLIQVVYLLPGLRSRQSKMPEKDKFTPTDNFDHRYANPKRLRQALINMGFKDKDIRIQATEKNGLEVQLPRQIDKKEKDAILEELVKLKDAERPVPKVEEEEE